MFVAEGDTKFFAAGEELRPKSFGAKILPKRRPKKRRKRKTQGTKHRKTLPKYLPSAGRARAARARASYTEMYNGFLSQNRSDFIAVFTEKSK